MSLVIENLFSTALRAKNLLYFMILRENVCWSKVHGKKGVKKHC